MSRSKQRNKNNKSQSGQQARPVESQVADVHGHVTDATTFTRVVPITFPVGEAFTGSVDDVREAYKTIFAAVQK